ncbi:MAG: serine/threonine-protein kinase [Polyangiaceae bacterium]|jgi:eukaryotic-like serine/threonine-protein kinase
MAEAVLRSGRLPELAKYEILEEIGHGGMATVYRARDRRLGRDVAVKVIHPHLRDSREVVSRFNAEARAVAKLRHRNIVEVYDVSAPEDAEQYLVVELVRGTTMRKLLEKRRALPPEIAAALAIELLGALAHANAAGVVHRDIKPENVLIEHVPPPEESPDQGRPSTGSRVMVKLTDFGIAKLLDAQGVTSTGQVLGSPAHMAPEQIEGGEVDARADVFGLGVLLYECMVGHLPFEGQNPAQVLRRVLDGTYPEAVAERPVVGRTWSALLDRALAHAQAARFPDAGAMKAAIAAELDRLAFPGAEGELEAWLDSPDAYEETHAKRMIDRLCSLADDARRKGNVLAAAADYNRALAHAPDDPQLLRIVAGMNRAEARARLLKRGLSALALAAGVGVLGFGLDHALRHDRHPANPAGGPGETPGAVAAVRADPSSSPVAPGGTESARRSPAAPRVAPAPAAPRPIERVITLDLKPPMGVAMSIDGQPTRDVSTGDRLTLDGKAHALTFSCPRSRGDDPCVVVRLAVAAGEKDDTLVVSVPVKPATLVVDGDMAKTYQVAQHPEVTVRAGTNTVALKSAYEAVTVNEMETGTSVSVRLEAGRTVHASFH